MRAAGDLRAHQCILRMESRCIDSLQGISSKIVVAVTGSAQQAGLTDLMLLHGIYHL